MSQFITVNEVKKPIYSQLRAETANMIDFNKNIFLLM